MKLHDLRPAEGSTTARTRVGRGIAAGKGKTAGRGTKGQKARAGGSIPPWFEGGQTPLHMRIPKLRGFKNRAKVTFEVVNVGDIEARIEAGSFSGAGTKPKKGEQLTINADILRAVGLVRNVSRPLKILGNGELSSALFVVADAFTKSAVAKIEAAGGVVNVLEVPDAPRAALGLGAESNPAPAKPAKTATSAKPAKTAAAAKPAKAAKAARAAKAATATDSEPNAPSAEAATPADSSTADITGDAPDTSDTAVTPDAEAPADDAAVTDNAATDGDESA